MRIEELNSSTGGGRVKCSATIVWEDARRPTQEVYFETDAIFSDYFSANPQAFLLGMFVPAMFYGEKRIYVDAEIDPELSMGINTAMKWLSHWFYNDVDRTVALDVKSGYHGRKTRRGEQTAFFFSGGVDSMATFCRNHNVFSIGHPRRISIGIIVFGLELDDRTAFGYVLDDLRMLADKLGITAIPVYTNLYLQFREEDAKHDFRFWIDQFQGAALAATAHVLDRHISAIYIGSSHDIAHLHPLGSHPLIDACYSSTDLFVRHDGIELSRLDKVKIIAEYEPVLQHLRVCNRFKAYQKNHLNCGKCDKCIRTMLELLAVGKLECTRAFPMQDVAAKVVDDARLISGRMTESMLSELLVPLAKLGRNDLVDAIKTKIRTAKIRRLFKK